MPISALTLVPGQAAGATFILQEPLSFWGGLDAASGRIIDRWHPQQGEVLSGKVLIMKAGRGSSSGSSVLAEAIRLSTGPSGIVLLTRDAIVAVGAMVAAELYAKHCPVVLVSTADWPCVVAAGALTVEAGPVWAKIVISDLGKGHLSRL
jgi:uncharacterized protein